MDHILEVISGALLAIGFRRSNEAPAGKTRRGLALFYVVVVFLCLGLTALTTWVMFTSGDFDAGIIALSLLFLAIGIGLLWTSVRNFKGEQH